MARLTPGVIFHELTHTKGSQEYKINTIRDGQEIDTQAFPTIQDALKYKRQIKKKIKLADQVKLRREQKRLDKLVEREITRRLLTKG
jgi:hypothetical protein